MCRKIEFRVFVRKPATIDSSCRSIGKHLVRAYHWSDRKGRLIAFPHGKKRLNGFTYKYQSIACQVFFLRTSNVYIVRILFLLTSVFFVHIFYFHIGYTRWNERNRDFRVPGLRWKWNERKRRKRSSLSLRWNRTYRCASNGLFISIENVSETRR